MARKSFRRTPKRKKSKARAGKPLKRKGDRCVFDPKPYEAYEYWWSKPPYNLKGSTGEGRLGAVSIRVAYLYELARRFEPAPFRREDLPPWPLVRHLWWDLITIFLEHEHRKSGYALGFPALGFLPLNKGVDAISIRNIMTINEGQSDPLLIKINLTASDAELKRDFLKIIELQRSRHGVAKLPPNKGTKYRKPQWGYIRYVDMESLSGNESHASMRSRAKADAEEYAPLLREMVHLVVVPYLMEVREKGTWKGAPIYFTPRPGLGWADDNVSSDRGPFEAYLMKQFSQKPRRSKRHAGKRPGLSLADLVTS